MPLLLNWLIQYNHDTIISKDSKYASRSLESTVLFIYFSFQVNWLKMSTVMNCLENVQMLYTLVKLLGKLGVFENLVTSVPWTATCWTIDVIVRCASSLELSAIGPVKGRSIQASFQQRSTCTWWTESCRVPNIHAKQPFSTALSQTLKCELFGNETSCWLKASARSGKDMFLVNQTAP